jgi:hypothetical protein
VDAPDDEARGLDPAAAAHAASPVGWIAVASLALFALGLLMPAVRWLEP